MMTCDSSTRGSMVHDLITYKCDNEFPLHLPPEIVCVQFDLVQLGSRRSGGSLTLVLRLGVLSSGGCS